MVNDEKTALVKKLTETVKASPIVGVVNLENLPAAQLQKMRKMLIKLHVEIVMARKRLLKLALRESKLENVDKLIEKVKGMPALIFTKDNPFTLYKTIQKNQSEAPAKPGQISPRDIVVPAGPTNFAPGPIISELAAVGIKTKVEGGKLSVINDTTIVKEGQEISTKVSETLKRLDIKPMKIGLDLVAVWEKGIVFDAKQLHIDEAEFMEKISNAASWAINLAVEAAIPTADTTELLLQKAFNDSKAISLETNFITELTAGAILAKVEAEANAVKDAGKIEVGPAPKARIEKKEAVEHTVETVQEPKNEGKAESAPKAEAKEEDTKPSQKPFAPEAPKEEAESAPKEEPKIEPAPKEERAPESHAPVEPKEEPAELRAGPVKTKPHPKQGTVSNEEAEDLLAKLQKEGTLR
jgi:large subunit ribosomal protein L10